MTDLSGQFLGRYYLVERLGEGGMAIVYKGYDTRLERDVAIKIIRSAAFPPEILSQILRRFEREAKSLAKLSHANIVNVYDYGEHDGSPYLVMEYLPGGTLKGRIGRPIPWKEALSLFIPVARGVAYAHQRGILHRDIKPANILLTDGNEPKLSDFGIAKLFETEQATALTGIGTAIGTPEYMAPEQWNGITSIQTDLYSLGVVLYEMVAGRKPFVADTPAAILLKQATEPLPSPRKFAADLPEVLEHILIKTLAREPENRYKDVGGLLQALENLPVHENATMPALAAAGEMYQTAPTDAIAETRQTPVPARGGEKPQPSIEDKRPASRRSRTALFAAGGILLVLISVFSLFQAGKWMASGTRQISNRSPAAPQSTHTPTLLPLLAAPAFTPTVQATGTAGADQQDFFFSDPAGNLVPMRFVPEGEFTYGSDSGISNEKPQQQVFLDAYYIDKFEVTNFLYKACVNARGCPPLKTTNSHTRTDYYRNPEYDNFPVINVDWHQASAYCAWRDINLPTEAQWEKAARGTDGRSFPWGNETIDCSKANYYDSVQGKACEGDTTPVGMHKDGGSPYGVFDLAGNVWEWVADFYASSHAFDLSVSNPTGPEMGVYRVLRGGSWVNLGDFLSTTRRVANDSNYSHYSVGFRCARNVEP